LKRKSEQKCGSAAAGRKSNVYYEQLHILETLAKPTKSTMEDGVDKLLRVFPNSFLSVNSLPQEAQSW